MKLVRFLWVYCQLQRLQGCRSIASLRNILNTLPQSLDETYERILTSISEDMRSDIKHILLWLAFSLRPLSVFEAEESPTLMIPSTLR